MTASIYVLQDPVSGVPRYPGKSNDPPGRLREHLRATKLGGQLPVHRWIRKLLRSGLLPVQRILEVVPDGVRWQDREKRWIRYFKRRGYKLLNLGIGGEGGIGGATYGNLGKKWSEEQRRSFSLIRTGKKRSEAARKNMSIAQLAARENNSIQHKRLWLLPEYRTKIEGSLFKPGHRVSEKTRRLSSERWLANPPRSSFNTKGGR